MPADAPPMHPLPLHLLPAAVVPWRRRLWPAPEPLPAAPPVLLLAAGIGVLAALTVRPHTVGLALPVVAVAALAVALGTRSRPLMWADVVATAAACCLFATGAVRGASWLAFLCLLAGCAVAAVGLVGARTWTGIVVGCVAAALAPAWAGRWAEPALRELHPERLPLRRVGLVAGASTVLLLVFGGLFAAADPAYRSLLGRAAPDLPVTEAVGRLITLVVVTALVVVAAWLAQVPPAVDALAPAAGRPVRRWEWVLPLAALDVLFLSFVLVQLAVLFGGRRHVLETEGLSYAEYARHGFWQLLVVTALTLVVVALAVRAAPRTSYVDRLAVRLLLGVLCTTALVIVASALQRMSLYQQEYGFTRLRLLVDAVELALGAVFVLLLAAGVRLSGSWLPRASVAVAGSALLALAALNPDAWIAEHNVARYAATGRLDVAYLSTLSADAVPALTALPAPLRDCALARVAAELARVEDPWYDVNLGRHRARVALADLPLRPCRVSR